MTCSIAILTDDTLEEPMIVLGVTPDHVAGLVAAYLRVARPLTTSGDRLVVPDAYVGSWERWLHEALDNVEDVDVEIYTTGDGSLMAAGDFAQWIAENEVSISRQHRPLVVDVVEQL